MLAKIPNTISVKAHKADWHILAVPSEKLQDPPGISVAMLHKHSHQFSNIYIFINRWTSASCSCVIEKPPFVYS